MAPTTQRRRGLRALTRSTRVRVLFAAIALLAGTLLLSIVADRALLLSRLDERIDDDLSQEVGEFERLATGIDPETGEPFAGDVEAIFDTFFARNVPAPDEVFLGLVDGEPYLRSADAPYPVDELTDLVDQFAATTSPGYSTVDTPGGSMRTLVVPVADAEGTKVATFVVGRFPAQERAEVDEAVRVAATVGVLAFVLAVGVAWLVAGRVLAPLSDLRSATQSIGEDRLDERIDVEGDDELADLARAFNAMLDRLEGAFAAQRAFLDDAGHELRTPITVIRGHLELSDASEPLSAATRAIVFDELDRMGRMVEDLLLIAKAERPDFVVIGPVDVADLTDDVVTKARPLADRRWEGRVGAVVVAEMDRERITQAWMNLVRNAVQHTAVDDRITVYSWVTDGVLELGVADTGEGVSTEDRDRIFERFSRGTSVHRTRSDGAGLGLAIASAIADAHGGSIEYRETPGGGATFVLRIPIPADDGVVDDTSTDDDTVVDDTATDDDTVVDDTATDDDTVVDDTATDDDEETTRWPAS